MNDNQAMKLAIEVAEGGAGFVAPNPLVGCVILDRNGVLLGKGFHPQVGGDHAEVDALKSVEESALEGAQVYVTLEPCAHQGRTPSCAKKLADLPIARVVYGLKDPNPMVSGKGAEILRASGKKVEEFSGLKDELEDLAEIFLHNMRRKQAFFALKMATSLDGHVAMDEGGGQWLTGEESLRHVQYLRGCYDAVMIGRKTFELDNPRLNIRHERFKNKKNKVFIVDSQGQALDQRAKSRLMEVHADEDVIWLVKEGVKVDAPHWTVPWDKHTGFDWLVFKQKAYDNGVTSVFVEGGAALAGSLLTGGFIDRWYQFIAPTLLGGGGLNLGTGLDVSGFDSRIRLSRVRWSSFGSDALVTGRFTH